MDQQQQIPTLRGETNKREEKKKSGLLGNLLGKLGGGGGASGAAGAGGAGFGGAAVSGGLLATKAGIIALILTGTTVAGGLGLVGYKLFGGSSGGGGGLADSFNSLFASRTKGGPAAEGQDGDKKGGSGDGSSSSLQFLADANKASPAEEQKKPDAAAAPAADASKNASADASASALAAAQKAAMANNNAPSSGPAAKLGGVGMKLGELSKNVSGGASSGASFSLGGGKANEALASAGQLGKMTGVGGPGAASNSSNKGISGVSRRGRALRQLGSVLRDNRGASNSGSAGRTYDGGAQQSSSFGGPQTSGIEGNGAGGKDKQLTNPTNNPANNLDNPNNSIPSVPGQPVTPWQKEMDIGKYALMGFLAFALLGNMAVKSAGTSFDSAVASATGAKGDPNAIVNALAGAKASLESAKTSLYLAIAAFVAAGAAGAVAMAMGGQIMGGQFNQHDAGLAFMIGGAGALGAATFAVLALKEALGAVEAIEKSFDADLIAAKTAAAQYNKDMAIQTPTQAEKLDAAHQVELANAAAAKAQADVNLALAEQTKTGAVVANKIDPLSFSGHALMYVTGGAAVVALGYNMLFSKPNTVDPSKCPKPQGCPTFRYHTPTLEEELVKQYLG